MPRRRDVEHRHRHGRDHPAAARSPRVAKQATSLDHLTANRFLLGLSTGDRPVEYPAFGATFDNRAERFRDGHAFIRAATERRFPRHVSEHYGRLDGGLDLVPKPVGPRLPMLAIGRARQSIGWLAGNMDGWIWHQSDFSRLGEVVAAWRAAVPDDTFKPYGYGTFFDLDRDAGAPLRSGRGLVAGRRALVDLLKRQQDEACRTSR